MVRGLPFPLSRVRYDQDMMDLMTDQEYQGYVDLERRHGPAQYHCSLLGMTDPWADW